MRAENSLEEIDKVPFVLLSIQAHEQRALRKKWTEDVGHINGLWFCGSVETCCYGQFCCCYFLLYYPGFESFTFSAKVVCLSVCINGLSCHGWDRSPH